MYTTVHNIYIIAVITLATYIAHFYPSTQHIIINIYYKFQLLKYKILYFYCIINNNLLGNNYK